MPLAQIRGQAASIDLISRALQSNRLPSAWLFVGPPSVGKRLTALLIAQTLNCRTYQGIDACGQCDPCRQIEVGNFADVELIEPSGQNIRMEQIQEALRWMQYRPERGHYRVLILDEADRMNRESANAFLKTLEEPPPQTTIILLTTSPMLLLETILSRCQQIRFQPLSQMILKDLLAEKTELANDDRNWLAKQGMGSVRLDLVKDVQDLRELRSQWGLWIQRIGATEMIEILPRCQEWSSAKDLTWERLLDWLETWLRDLAWLLHELPEIELLNQDQLPTLRKCLQHYNSESVLVLYEAVLEARHNIARNANKTLQLEGLWLRLKHLQEA
jgi:DNA polymerase-3 subunit delta'